MALEKVTKLQDLRARKKKLREELILLDEKIRQAGKDLQQQGFKAFMDKGTAETPADLELQKLKKRLVFLQGIARILDELLVKTVRHDRQQKIKWFKRELARTEKARKKRHDYYIKLREQAKRVQEEDKGFDQERLDLESQLNAIKRPEKEESLRLCKLEEFLKREFLLGDDLRIKVLEARKHNREILEKVAPGIDDIIYRNFQIKYSLESGQTLELELTEQKAEKILRNFDKRKLIREVT